MQRATDGIPPACQRLQRLAERHPRRAVPLAYRALASLQAKDKDSVIAAWHVYTLGWALLYWERFAEARRHIIKAHDTFLAFGQLTAALHCTFALHLADLHQFAHVNLADNFAAAAEQFRLAGLIEDAVRARLYQALLLNLLGRLAEAEIIFDQIAPVLRQNQPLDYARLVLGRGVAAITQSDYTRADTFLTEAEYRFTALGNPLERAKCWFQRAWMALRQEQLDVALAGYQRAEQAFVRFAVPVRLALCSKAIGLILIRKGAYDEALSVLLSALRSFTALGRIGDVAACLLNVGNISFYTGQWDEALAWYTCAESLYTVSGIVGEHIIVQRNRAMIYRLQQRFVEARALLDTVEARGHMIGDQAEVAEIWGGASRIACRSGTKESRLFTIPKGA